MLLGLLAVAEVLSRLLPRSNPGRVDEIMENNPVAIWSLGEGCGPRFGVETCVDDWGLRRRAGPLPEARRVMFVGDSSVFGVGLRDERTFAALFAARYRGSVAALNGGTPGYSSTQALAMLEDRWLEAEPALLVVATLWSDNNFDTFVDGDLLARRPPAWLRQLVKWSALAERLAGGGSGGQIVGWGPSGQSPILARRRVPLGTYVANLERMVERQAAHGGEVAFLMLANVEDLERPGRSWAWDPYREAMRAVAARHGAVLVEVPGLWRQSGKGRRLLLDEMHPSELGAQVIAEGLGAALDARGFALGKPTMQEGDPSASPPVHDPWTDAHRPGLPGPSVAGVVQLPGGGRQALLVRATDPASGTLLDEVSLPAQAPFSLDLGSATAARLEVRDSRHSYTLRGADLDLSRGKAWGVTIDLATGQVSGR